MIPLSKIGTKGETLIFLHANGYPPECYNPLLVCLSVTNQVIAMHQRPLWENTKPEDVDSWHPFTSDLFRFLDEQKQKKVIAIGHSIGGIVILRAAIQQPERFRALVVIDPVLLPPAAIRVVRFMRDAGYSHRIHPLANSTLNRRQVFSDMEQAFVHFRSKRVFKYFSDQALRAYIAGLLKTRADGQMVLVYSPEWETRIYRTGIWNDMDLWQAFPQVQVPILMIRGMKSETLWKSTTQMVIRKQARIQLTTIEKSTHLVPLEQPDRVCTAIKDFLATHIINH